MGYISYWIGFVLWMTFPFGVSAYLHGQTPTPIAPMHRLANGTEVPATRLLTGSLLPFLSGYWRSGGYYVPCNATVPYQTWTVPSYPTQPPVYLRGDMDVTLLYPNLYPQHVGQIFGNHSDAYYDTRGMMIPVRVQPSTPNYYPAPADVSQLCTQWTQNGNTSACPGGTAQWYTNKFANNPVWTSAWAFYQPQYAADCNNPQPTFTRTPTSAPVFTPTPTVTPGPSPFTNWVYQAVAEKMMNPCGPSLFCIGDASQTTWQGIVSRGQMSVYLLKAEHGTSYVPPACTATLFQDVPCPGHP